MPHDPGAPAKAKTTGLERESLRQAVHDLRNRLNAMSIGLHTADAALGKGDANLAAQKVSQAVRELQTVGRLLDQLVASSDSVALEMVPIDLGAAVADASRSVAASARGVTVHVDAPQHAPNLVLSCPSRLPRMLAVILDRCIAALPAGGDVRFAVEPGPEWVRLVTAASGPRVVAPARGAAAFELNDGTLGGGWFAVKALVRGLRGDVRVSQEGGSAIRIEVDLPGSDPHARDADTPRNP